MSHTTTHHVDELMAELPALIVPFFEEPDPEGLGRRQRKVVRTRVLREAIRAESGPLQVSTNVLKHEVRESVT